MKVKNIWKIAIPFAIILLGILSMQVLTSFKTEPPRREPTPHPKIVEAQVVKLGSVASTVTSYGRMTTAQPVVLISEVAGKLQRGSVPFQPGQNFRRGDLLVKVDDRQARLDVNSTKSDLLNSLAQVLPEIKVDFPEQFPIWQAYFNDISFDKKLAPLPEVSNQKIKLFVSRFNVYKLFFAVRNLEIRLDKHYFYAPFSGSIAATDLRIGSTARSGTRLGEITNLEDFEVEVPVAAKDIRWINRSKPVTFSSTEVAGEWNGKIKRIGRTIDTQTQTIPVFISFDKSKSDLIYNGVFLNARIPGKIIDHAIAIPAKAIYNDHFVYLVKNSRLKFQAVEIARRETDTVIVTGGLQTNDTLVVEVLQGVAAGMLAKPHLLSLSEKSRR